MFSHIMVGTNDLDRAKSFYDAVLGALGIAPAMVDGQRIFYMTPTGVFSVSMPIDGAPATHANGGTIGFAAKSPEQADAWHAAGVAAGGKTCEDPRGCAKAAWARSTSPICATRTATRSAPCTGCRRRDGFSCRRGRRGRAGTSHPGACDGRAKPRAPRSAGKPRISAQAAGAMANPYRRPCLSAKRATRSS